VAGYVVQVPDPPGPGTETAMLADYLLDKL